MTGEGKVLQAVFFATETGREPVREWLKEGLGREECRTIGTDLKTVEFGWPLGMPLVRKLGPDLWEVRSNLPRGTARVLFTVIGSEMVLLHGFLKKSQRTPLEELETARARMALLRYRGD